MDKELVLAAIEGLRFRRDQIDTQINHLVSSLNGSQPADAPVTVYKKRVMSEEARRRIGAATRKRWADQKAKTRKDKR